MNSIVVTYRLGETHETVERHAVVREVDGLRGGDTERVGIQGEASNDNVILDDVALDVASTIRDLERLVGVLERRRALRTEEGVVALETREKKRIS